MSAAANRERDIQHVSAHQEAERAPLIRIRTLLLLGLVVGTGLWAYPRAQAAWQLHGHATAFANYALCMVGPTGPATLRDNAIEFRHLVRRRLIAAQANERPFARCARDAKTLSGSVNVERSHRATAWSFVEYGAVSTKNYQAGALSLDSLEVTSASLARLSEQAWPFSRKGYTKLIRPNLNAHEAIHPIALPRPSIGRGLPRWRARYRSVKVQGQNLRLAYGKAANLSALVSEDGGLTFKPTSPRGLGAIAERCLAGEGKSFTFGLSAGGSHTVVISYAAETDPVSVRLAPASHEVFAASCDQEALVAAVRSEDSRSTYLFVCRFAEACAPMPSPHFSGVGAPIGYPLDLARLGGATVIVFPMKEIVRVTSSRDDGKTWTPIGVAYDRQAHPSLAVDISIPDRLLVAGKRLILYAGADEAGKTYPVLFSDDLGASFRAH